jgi:hypothetical protein
MVESCGKEENRSMGKWMDGYLEQLPSRAKMHGTPPT